MVSRLAKSQQDDYVIEAETPYAEFWLGNHPAAPCHVRAIKGCPATDAKKNSKSKESRLGQLARTMKSIQLSPRRPIKQDKDAAPEGGPDTSSHAHGDKNQEGTNVSMAETKTDEEKTMDKDAAIPAVSESQTEGVVTPQASATREHGDTAETVPETETTAQGHDHEIVEPAPELQDFNQYLKSRKASIPYLLKVLSIREPLSLQLHPDLENAKKLHEEFPQIYKDPYDKPEMAIAVSEIFELFCGFRKVREILTFAEKIPEFGQFVAIDLRDDEPNFLRAMMKNIYTAPDQQIKEVVSGILAMASKAAVNPETVTASSTLNSSAMMSTMMKNVKAAFGTQSGEDAVKVALDLFARLHKYYPGERGLLACFVLNYIVLQAGESCGLGPNTIHAYIKGDCVECMKSSDNVIRAGLTPKFQDVDRLLALVEYKVRILPLCMQKFFCSL